MRRSAVILLALAASGCESYRVEYHKRPAYMMTAAGMKENESVELDDGTVIFYATRDVSPPTQANAEDGARGKRFQIRDEGDDGEVVLRCLLPQHVLANLLTCLRNEEYELIWDQLLSEHTRTEYELRGETYEDFEHFFATNRLELAATLTRMMLGLTNGDAFMKSIGGGVVKIYFHPRVASDFEYKTIEVAAESGGMRLLMIR